jgi:hypothetical protein
MPAKIGPHQNHSMNEFLPNNKENENGKKYKCCGDEDEEGIGVNKTKEKEPLLFSDLEKQRKRLKNQTDVLGRFQ